MTPTSRSKLKRIDNWSRVFKFYGGRRCMGCGYTSPLPVYELHHHDQAGKETNVSQIMHHSWAKVEEELHKCILVCANCHRVLHHLERERKK